MAMKRDITCIGCPLGCSLEVTLDDGRVVSVTGNDCPRGVSYARQECVHPERMVTALIMIPGRTTPLSVKTQRPVPKDKITACLRAIAEARPALPVRIGEVILQDVAGTGVAVVATRDLE
ncbi:MAG: DUF1667 domain-containing protein [Lentisphaeria bacterium]|nr:DUF1667 domain-containing protein [Lentisphaeria bacterium]